ncbi:DEAD/DEAH box helicase [uncultured Aeromicrobium sp.]|uniref:DEAD/DEAH box helicase n=1 Tax=uncultured Aeromicrobium sp. TaxID=337820 RepID=UPI0025E81F28|nr:DEAD/DEAH box helicase [uncultured Aeromicrobium sp.]
MPSSTQLMILLRHPVRFLVDGDPERSRFVFDTPQGPVEATANEAVGPLSGGIRAMNAHESVRAWAGPAIIALRLMAAGALTSPTTAELQQLREAGSRIGVTAAEGQRQIDAFLAALAVDAPAVATTPQRRRTPDQPRPRIEPPRTFAYRLIIAFGASAADAIATARLRVRPTDRTWGEADAHDLWAREDHHFGPGARDATRALLERLSASWEPARRLLPPGDGNVPPEQIALDRDELGRLASAELVTPLMANRVEVSWPTELIRDVTATPVIQRVDTFADRPRAFGRDQLFRFDWSVSVGGERLTQAELDELAASHSGLVRLRDRWVFVEPRRLDGLLQGGGRELDASDALRAALTGELQIDGRMVEVDTVGWLEDVRKRLASLGARDTRIEQPTDLDGHLRTYQLDGLRWMNQLVELGLGGILADDMGLGKTIMLIALHLHRAAPAPTLVVCPASVLATWEREIARFAPGENVLRYHGPQRSLNDAKDGFVITTYATMRQSVEELAEHDWGMVVADEAQHVKNAASGAALALRRIGSDARMALTGTPVENSLSELWSILDWTTPGLLGHREQFRRDWARPIERDRDDEVARRLATLIRPFVLRRRKNDPGIAPELPPKIETDHHVQLTREQIGLYEAVVRQTMTEIEESRGIQRRGLVVKLLTQLKQICNHPAQYLRQPSERLDGRSGKLTVFDELLDEILAEDGRTLVFTQYAQMGRLLARHLDHRGIAHAYLHGGTPVRTREDMVRRFQDGGFPVFVLSLKAAGTGLNLTRADHVIHYDRWWNPAVEDQATDRAHRIGQTTAVHVHRLVTEGTIEQSIAELISAKRALADAVVNSGEAALTELSDAELASLVRLRR